MLWIFNGSVEPTQPGMNSGLGWRSGQGGSHSRVLLFKGKRNACEDR